MIYLLPNKHSSTTTYTVEQTSTESNGAQIYQERSETGILGQFSRVGGASLDERITFASQYENNEGPLIFHDNRHRGLYHLWIDENTLQSYIPATARTLDDMKAWEPQSLNGFPKGIKHGSVIPVTQAQYDALEERYDFV